MEHRKRRKALARSTAFPPVQKVEKEVDDVCRSRPVVCLTETPIEHVWMMCEDIADRGHPLAQYGLALPKAWAREAGANPFWYIDVRRTGHRGADWLTVPLMNIMKQTLRGGGERSLRARLAAYRGSDGS